MSKEWFARVAGEVVGPMDLSDLRSMLAAKRLSEFDEFRRSPHGDWQPASEIKSIKSAGSASDRTDAAAMAVLTGSEKHSPTWTNPVQPVIAEPTTIRHLHGSAPQPNVGIGAIAKKLTIAVACLLGIGFVGAILFVSLKEDPGVRDERAAVKFAKESVLAKLKAPATAEFIDSATATEKIEGDAWRVAGEIDAQNSFGAKVRSSWSVVVEKQGDGTWIAREAKVVGR